MPLRIGHQLTGKTCRGQSVIGPIAIQPCTCSRLFTWIGYGLTTILTHLGLSTEIRLSAEILFLRKFDI